MRVMHPNILHNPNYFKTMNALTAAGHWGVPTMAYAQETFFGQDRIDVLAWCIEQQTKN